MRFCPLFSSSSGNSVYIGNGDSGILVDVGRSAKQITQKLNEIDVKPESIKAIFITHEHSDHIKGLSVFASKNNIPVYGATGTILSLKKSGVLSEKHFDNIISDDGVEVADFFVKPFRTSHDCEDGRGYVITNVNGGENAAIMTDTGYVSNEMLSAVTGCKLLYIESNHDIAMLRTGEYPYVLKQRILSNSGHLSNDACAASLRALVNRGTTQFVLAHLSEHNNTPELAFNTSVSALSEMGALIDRDYLLDVATPENERKPYFV